MTLPDTAAELRQIAEEIGAGAIWELRSLPERLRLAAGEIEDMRAELIAVRARGFAPAAADPRTREPYLQERRR